MTAQDQLNKMHKGGISLRKLAKICGINPRTVTKILKGKPIASASACRAAFELGINYDEFKVVGGSEQWEAVKCRYDELQEELGSTGARQIVSRLRKVK